MARGGIFQLVLHRLEEVLSDLAFAVVVHRECENLLDLLIHSLLTGTDIPNPLQQFIKVVSTEFTGIAQSLVIEGKALLHVLSQNAAGPPAEVYAHIAPHPITDGQNHVEIVVVALSGYLPGSFSLNCSEFPNSCFGFQFSIFKNIADMLTDGRLGYLVKLTHCFLSHPDCIFLKIDINFGIALFVLINQDFSRIRQFTAHNPSSFR